MILKEKFITKTDLDQIERYADKLFAKVGIDIEFTRHFLDRVNDERNKKQITTAELTRLFKQTYAKHGKKIAQLGPDAEGVIKDMRTDLNMPFVLNLKNGELDLVAKTIMRKKNFKTPNPELAVESVMSIWKKKHGIITESKVTSKDLQSKMKNVTQVFSWKGKTVEISLKDIATYDHEEWSERKAREMLGVKRSNSNVENKGWYLNGKPFDVRKFIESEYPNDRDIALVTPYRQTKKGYLLISSTTSQRRPWYDYSFSGGLILDENKKPLIDINPKTGKFATMTTEVDVMEIHKVIRFGSPEHKRLLKIVGLEDYA